VSTTIARGPLTTRILVALRVLGYPVGDGEMPDASWIGQPNAPDASYEPFAVLSALVADRSDGPLGDSQADWRMPYMVEYFGITREQTAWMADKMRATLAGLRFSVITLGDADYKVQYVRNDNIGSPQRVSVTNPPFWQQQDGVTLWMGKERT
jgi:hypothetical protein